MSNANARIHEFVFRGVLADESLDRAGRKNGINYTGPTDEQIADTLSLNALPNDLVAKAKAMSAVYTAVAAFENSVRELISGVLLESVGDTWWGNAVSQKVRDRAEKRKDDEDKIRWHTNRGQHPIYYTTMADLVNIMRNNWEAFEPYAQSIDWVASIFDGVERSRNVIMHSGTLEPGDIERLGIFIRDWIKQVGV